MNFLFLESFFRLFSTRRILVEFFSRSFYTLSFCSRLCFFFSQDLNIFTWLRAEPIMSLRKEFDRRKFVVALPTDVTLKYFSSFFFMTGLLKYSLFLLCHDDRGSMRHRVLLNELA